MPLVYDLLNPIEGSNPSGADLRYDDVYDKIKEARREEAVPPPGMSESDRKLADNPLVIKLTTDLLTKKTKDLWLAAWLTEAWVKQTGFSGLRDGLSLCHGLVEKFWDTIYPQLEDGDAEMRAAPLEFLATRLDIPLKSVALVAKEPFGLIDILEARKLGYEDDAKSDEAKQARAAALEQGKVAIEVIDKCFEATPKVFYAQTEKEILDCLANLAPLKQICNDKFGDVAPSLGRLESVLGEIKPVVHGFLQKKREKEPDPVEPGQEQPESAAAATSETGPELGRTVTVPAGGIVIPLGDKEPAERRGAITAVASAAAALRKLDPTSPAPYLMMRGLRWGELRAAFSRQDLTLLEGPPTELRQHIKRLAIEGKWNELLEAAENCMSLPCSRGWLDLQKFAVDACAGLGSDYTAIALAIRSELKTLARDVPQVLDANLLDDTPAANSETRAWLQELVAEAPTPAPEGPAAPDGAPAGDGADGAPSVAVAVVENHSAPGWHRKFADSYDLATEALKAGQAEKAIDTMTREVERQLSGRGQFFRKLQLVEICVAAGKPEIAQPIIEDLSASIENNHLETWENPKTVAKALVMIMKHSQRVQQDDSEKQRLFQKVVRLDPVQAITCLGN